MEFFRGSNGKEIYLKDIWPSDKEIEDTLKTSLNADMFVKRYSMSQRDQNNGNKLIRKK